MRESDTKLVGIDFRVQNGKLYGVGDRGGIYTLDKNARAVKVSRLTVALSGWYFGVDFNPAANRLRVISDTGQNLRPNIDDPAAPLAVRHRHHQRPRLTAVARQRRHTRPHRQPRSQRRTLGRLRHLLLPRKGTNHGFAALKTGGSHRFYKVDVLTGQAQLIGTFPASRRVTDIALPLDQN